MRAARTPYKRNDDHGFLLYFFVSFSVKIIYLQVSTCVLIVRTKELSSNETGNIRIIRTIENKNDIEFAAENVELFYKLQQPNLAPCSLTKKKDINFYTALQWKLKKLSIK